MRFKDREIIRKCGLDAYFFLRYLQTLLVIFIPIAVIVIPILVPINYVGGLGRSIVSNNTNSSSDQSTPQGLDTLAWGNVDMRHQNRRWAHLILAVLVIVWVWFVFFTELKIYVKVRQDYLTSAEHRLRASANTVLVSSIPEKWLSEEALRGLFDVFPGGIRNIWLTRDFSKLLDKIHKRDDVHDRLEGAETDLIRACKKREQKARAMGEKKARKSSQVPAESKAEKAERLKAEDQEAKRRAESGGGVSAGDHEDVPHNATQGGSSPLTGIREDVSAVGGAGHGAVAGAKLMPTGLDGEVGRTGGFEHIKTDDNGPSKAPAKRKQDRPGQVMVPHRDDDDDGSVDEKDSEGKLEDRPKLSFASDAPMQTPRSRHAPSHSNASQDVDLLHKEGVDCQKVGGNTVRKSSNMQDMYITERTWWWEFWKPPTGAYASPVPQGAEGHEFPLDKSADKGFWQHVRTVIPFLGDGEEAREYDRAYTRDYDRDKEENAAWQQWLKPKDRPQHRLPFFDWTPTWLPGLPLMHKKVDTIYWCRAELARLNLEIEEDQAHPERYPVMNAAFIQFNSQVAAHMACQSVTHHLPKTMAPRTVEISPDDVIWENMAIKWWEGALRTAAVLVIVAGMVILWAVPVSLSASLLNIEALIKKLPWLSFLTRNDKVYTVVKGVAGILPTAVLALLLILVPIIMSFLAKFQGAKTGSQQSEMVQTYYFTFLFVQVFLVVSVAGGAWQVIAADPGNVGNATQLLAENLPKAADYFFTYMILQALSTSSGTLLQIGTLLVWYVVAAMLDNTARSKWRRNTQLPTIAWGPFFPVYTNFACIALIYCIIAPVISIFAIITFSVLWFANRYQMLYVTRFKTDTGGVLYPTAIFQTFTGLYVMELCLIGLFFLSKDENGDIVGFPMAIIMIVMLAFTVLFQYLLMNAFGPLLRYLPVTFEDEAVLRDEAFRRAQQRRLGMPSHDEADEASTLLSPSSPKSPGESGPDNMEMRPMQMPKKGHTRTGGPSFRFGPLSPMESIRRGGHHIRHRALGKAEEGLRQANEYRRLRRQRDLEAQRAMGDALYGGYHDEIEDLMPEERDVLVRKAFQHYALRARRPTVWIPRDDVGVSDDEVARTREFSDHIWVSNEGTALDSKVRVVYGRNPPDFSEVDLINL